MPGVMGGRRGLSQPRPLQADTGHTSELLMPGATVADPNEQKFALVFGFVYLHEQSMCA